MTRDGAGPGPLFARAANRNTLWGSVVADELARCGVSEVALSPGSRSTPLVLAFAADERFRVRAFLDERSASFFALGVARASGVPAAVVTTSGTAAANVLPAVVEADASHTPMVVLTADRPHRLRGMDANQAIDQVKLYGERARLFAEVAPPEPTGPALRHLRGLACRAVAAALGDPAGPVHLNLPFDKPLEPTLVPGDVPEGLADAHPLAVHGRPDGSPFTRTGPVRAAPDETTLQRLATLLEASARGVIVVGPHERATDVGPAALRLARATGLPLLADPLSGARFAPDAPASALGAYDLFVEHAGLEPDLVVRLGDTPTSAGLARWLEVHSGVPHVVLAGPGRHRDHLALASEHVGADPVLVATDLAERVDAAADKAWTAAWREAEARTNKVVADQLDGEALVAATVARAMPEGSTLFVGNSMPVRDLDAFASPRDVEVRAFGNRGASGIDGVVSSALGAAAATDGPTVALLGDLSFLHDLNGLQALAHDDVDATLVVVNNDGGGIFHFLPIADHEPPFTELFATPHGLDLAHAAALHGLEHERLTPAALSAALGDALAAGGSRVLEVTTDRNANRDAHATVRAAVREALTDDVHGGTP